MSGKSPGVNRGRQGGRRRVCVVGRFLAGSSFAHAINTVRIAHSFARLGQEVTIVCRRDPERDWDTAQLARHYGLEQPVRWVLKRHPWGRGWRRGRGALGVAGLVGEWIIHRPDLVYARDFTAPGWACRLGIPVVLESHAHPEADAWPAGFERAVGASHRAKFRTWITISTRLAERYRELGADPGKLLVLPGGVDLRQFARPDALPASPYPSTTRQPVAPSSIATPLGNSGRVAGRVVYAGHLYDYKGIPTVLAAATALPDVSFELVGGWPQDVERHREAAKSRGINNVTFHGLLPQAQLPPYLWHADALLLPPSATHPSAMDQPGENGRIPGDAGAGGGVGDPGPARLAGPEPGRIFRPRRRGGPGGRVAAGADRSAAAGGPDRRGLGPGPIIILRTAGVTDFATRRV